MAQNVGEVFLNVKVDDQGVTKQINSAGKGWTKTMGKVGALAGAALGAGMLAAFTKSALKLGSDIREIQNVVDVTFGSMSGIIDRWAQDAVFSLGLAELKAKQFTGTMGAMLKSMGYGEEAAAGMSMELVSLAADIASFYNLDHDEAFSKIQSGMAGMTQPLRQLGIDMTVGSMEAFMLAEGINASWGELNQASQAMIRYQYLMSVTTDQQGDFLRTQGDWANQTRILRNQWDSFKSSFGAGLINLFNPILQGINRIMTGLVNMANLFSAFTSALMGNEVKEASGGIASGMGDAAEETNDLAKATTKAGKAAKGALAGFDKLNVLMSPDSSAGSAGAGGGAGMDLTGLLDFTHLFDQKPEVDVDTSKAEAAAARLKQVWERAGFAMRDIWDRHLKAPIEMVANWIQSTIVPRLIGTWEIFKSGVLGVIEPLYHLVRDVFSDIWNGVVSGLPGMLDSIGGAFNGIMDIVDSTIGFVFKIITDYVNILRGVWAEHGEYLVAGAVEFAQGIWDWIDKLINQWIKPAWLEFVGMLSSVWDSHLKHMVADLLSFVAELYRGALDVWNKFVKPIVDWLIVVMGPTFRTWASGVITIVQQVFIAISKIIKSVIQVLRGLLDFVVGVLTGDWKRAWGGIKNIFSGTVNIMISIIEGAKRIIAAVLLNIFNVARSIFSSMFNVIKDPLQRAFTWVQNALTGMKNSFTTVFNGLFATIRNTFSSVANVIKTPINGAIDLINRAISGMNKISLPDWIPGVGGKGVNLPKIPRLAQGGIVSQPTLAVVGDNRRSAEVVAPLHKLMGMMEQASGNKESARLLAELVQLMRAMQFPDEIVLDGRKAGDVLLKPLMERARQRGTPWPVRG